LENNHRLEVEESNLKPNNPPASVSSVSLGSMMWEAKSFIVTMHWNPISSLSLALTSIALVT
jgi:hypothetical protein